MEGLRSLDNSTTRLQLLSLWVLFTVVVSAMSQCCCVYTASVSVLRRQLQQTDRHRGVVGRRNGPGGAGRQLMPTGNIYNTLLQAKALQLTSDAKVVLENAIMLCCSTPLWRADMIAAGTPPLAVMIHNGMTIGKPEISFNVFRAQLTGDRLTRHTDNPPLLFGSLRRTVQKHLGFKKFPLSPHEESVIDEFFRTAILQEPRKKIFTNAAEPDDSCIVDFADLIKTPEEAFEQLSAVLRKLPLAQKWIGKALPKDGLEFVIKAVGHWLWTYHRILRDSQNNEGKIDIDAQLLFGLLLDAVSSKTVTDQLLEFLFLDAPTSPNIDNNLHTIPIPEGDGILQAMIGNRVNVANDWGIDPGSDIVRCAHLLQHASLEVGNGDTREMATLAQVKRFFLGTISSQIKIASINDEIGKRLSRDREWVRRTLSEIGNNHEKVYKKTGGPVSWTKFLETSLTPGYPALALVTYVVERFYSQLLRKNTKYALVGNVSKHPEEVLVKKVVLNTQLALARLCEPNLTDDERAALAYFFARLGRDMKDKRISCDLQSFFSGYNLQQMGGRVVQEEVSTRNAVVLANAIPLRCDISSKRAGMIASRARSAAIFLKNTQGVVTLDQLRQKLTNLSETSEDSMGEKGLMAERDEVIEFNRLRQSPKDAFNSFGNVLRKMSLDKKWISKCVPTDAKKFVIAAVQHWLHTYQRALIDSEKTSAVQVDAEVLFTLLLHAVSTNSFTDILLEYLFLQAPSSTNLGSRVDQRGIAMPPDDELLEAMIANRVPFLSASRVSSIVRSARNLLDGSMHTGGQGKSTSQDQSTSSISTTCVGEPPTRTLKVWYDKRNSGPQEWKDFLNTFLNMGYPALQFVTRAVELFYSRELQKSLSNASRATFDARLQSDERLGSISESIDAFVHTILSYIEAALKELSKPNLSTKTEAGLTYFFALLLTDMRQKQISSELLCFIGRLVESDNSRLLRANAGNICFAVALRDSNFQAAVVAVGDAGGLPQPSSPKAVHCATTPPEDSSPTLSRNADCGTNDRQLLKRTDSACHGQPSTKREFALGEYLSELIDKKIVQHPPPASVSHGPVEATGASFQRGLTNRNANYSGLNSQRKEGIVSMVDNAVHAQRTGWMPSPGVANAQQDSSGKGAFFSEVAHCGSNCQLLYLLKRRQPPCSSEQPTKQRIISNVMHGPAVVETGGPESLAGMTSSISLHNIVVRTEPSGKS